MTTSGNVSCPINNNNNDLRKTTTKLRFLYDYVPKADWANYPTNWMNDWGSEWVREWMNECECKRMGFALLINLIVVVLVNPTIMPYQTACLLRQVSLSCLIRILILIPMPMPIECDLNSTHVVLFRFRSQSRLGWSVNQKQKQKATLLILLFN